MNAVATEIKWTADRIVGLFDHAILQPTLTDAEMSLQIEQVRPYPVASICIKPYAVPLAVKAVRGTKIEVGTVIGFPHGSPATAIKVAETRQAFVEGCADVDMVVNVGKVLGKDWNYVHDDIAAVLAVTRENDGVVKIIFETDFLPHDEHKIKLCEICTQLNVDFVKTSTGFGFVKQADGNVIAKGATEHDVRLMRTHTPAHIGVKPSGGVRTLDDVLRFVELGATRIGTTSTASIHAAALVRFGS